MWDKGVNRQGNPDDRGEQDKKPLEQILFPKNVFETMLAAPHCADRVDVEVDRQRGGDDDGYDQGMELRQLMSEYCDAGCEEERVHGEDL